MDKPLMQIRARSPGTCDSESERIIQVQRTPEAFGELYDCYSPAVYRYLLSRLGNVEEAQDVTSQTFLKAIEAFPRYDHRDYFSAWLFSIARSKCIDFIRRKRREGQSGVDDLPDPQPDPSNAVLASERKVKLAALIRALNPREQELLRLRYVADLSFAEMAGLLRKKEDAVKKSVYRLLGRLRDQLEE